MYTVFDMGSTVLNIHYILMKHSIILWIMCPGNNETVMTLTLRVFPTAAVHVHCVQNLQVLHSRVFFIR